ncbi:MAG: TIGR01777 family oxidoreductase [Acidimicrobiia bacterium]
MTMDVAVTGSSGLIGSALRPALEAAGHRVLRLVRPASGGGGPDTIRWDPPAGTIDAGGLEGVGAVVNLAGEGIGDKRWNDAQKALILNSRVKGTTLLAETLAKLAHPPRVLVSGSAVDIYRSRVDEPITEDTPADDPGFLGEVCRAWEAATAPAEAAGIRVAHLRTGIVLSPHGGALKKMILPFKGGLGGRMGSGRQWMSWIAIDDEVGAIVHLLGEDAPSGPVNATAPNPVTNAEFTRVLAGVFRRPALMPLPAAALRLALGAQMAEELVLSGQRVLPGRLEASGYTFRAPDLEQALKQLVAS